MIGVRQWLPDAGCKLRENFPCNPAPFLSPHQTVPIRAANLQEPHSSVASWFPVLLHPARHGARTDRPVLRNDGDGLRTDGSLLKTDDSGLRTGSSGLRTERSLLNPDGSGLRTDTPVARTDTPFLSKIPDFPHFLMKAPQKSLFRGKRR